MINEFCLEIKNSNKSFPGVKALDNKNTVIFYPIQKVKDTIDGMWVSGLPNQVKIILTGQEYITVGQIAEIE